MTKLKYGEPNQKYGKKHPICGINIPQTQTQPLQAGTSSSREHSLSSISLRSAEERLLINANPSCDVTIFVKGAQNAQFSFLNFSHDF